MGALPSFIPMQGSVNRGEEEGKRGEGVCEREKGGGGGGGTAKSL